MEKRKIVTVYDMHYDNQEKDPSVYDITLQTEDHLNLIKAYENAGVITIINEREEVEEMENNIWKITKVTGAVVEHEACDKCGMVLETPGTECNCESVHDRLFISERKCPVCGEPLYGLSASGSPEEYCTNKKCHYFENEFINYLEAYGLTVDEAKEKLAEV